MDCNRSQGLALSWDGVPPVWRTLWLAI
uniref:Uncharacterized protein n=1 Tax=Arundo donax TaxID=35708 RepID=A0A0A8ZQT2_ARUDO